MKPRLGFIGFGVIGGYLYRQITSAGDAAVILVYHADRGKTPVVPSELLLGTPEAMAAWGVDLVVEAAHPKAVRGFGLPCCGRPTSCPFPSRPFATTCSGSRWRKPRTPRERPSKSSMVPSWRWTESPMGERSSSRFG